MSDTDILECELVADCITEYAAKGNFLYFGPVCKQWRKSWGERPQKTAMITTSTSILQLKEAGLNGIPLYNLCSMSSALGRLDLAYYSKIMGSPWLDSLARAAATLDDLNVLQRLRKMGCPMTSGTFEVACFNGNMDMVKYLMKAGCPHGRCIEYAACSANLGTVQWLRDKGAPIDADSFAEACLTGSVELIQWFKDQDCDFDSRVMHYAARSGNLAAVEFVYDEMNLRIGRDTARAAAALPDTSILRWLRQKECPWGESTCTEASMSGRLENLKYARAHGCAWGSSVCSGAAEHGHFEVLKWARENGCEWDSATLRGAASAGRLDILEWSITNGCPSSKDTLICASAAGGSHLAVLRWLRGEKQFPWDVGTLVRAAGAGCFGSVEYCLDGGLELDASVVAAAVLQNQFQMVKFLIEEKGCPVDERAVKLAQRSGDTQMLRCCVSRS